MDLKTRRERGMVTAELAVIMPFAVVFALILLWVVSLGITQVKLTDAAREGARLVARGETTATATKAAKRLAPDGSHVDISVSGESVRVRVATTSELPIPGLSIGAQELDAESVAVVEGS